MSEDVVVVDDAARFRQILGSFPTGVTVVTTLEEGHPVGMAAGSFFSVSLDPPLVGFCVMTTSNTWPLIERSGSFGVSILADDQTAICKRLASKAPDKFDGVPWSPSAHGSPVLDGVVAWIDGELWAEYDGGDHTIAVARVLDLGAHADRRPLLFHRGAYGLLRTEA